MPTNKGTNNKSKVATEEGQYNISITGRHVQVTDAMKAYAFDKISKLDRIAPRIIDVNVVMDIQKLNHRVDIVMKYAHTMIKSTASTTDMYVSIDQAIHRLQARLKRYLTRLHEHHAKNYAIVEVPEKVYPMLDLDEINESIEQETERELKTELVPHHIVRTEKQPLKILTDGEAIMKMDLSMQPIMVFRGEEDQKIRVIYRRDDGNYGIIFPE